MLGKAEGKRRRGQQRMRWLDGTTDSMDMEIVRDRGREGQGVTTAVQEEEGGLRGGRRKKK